LPSEPYAFAEWRLRRVGIDYHVEVEAHFYSMSSIMRRRRGLISAIGGSCPGGWASTTTILSDGRPASIRSPHSRDSGFVQSPYFLLPRLRPHDLERDRV
jgi:hypothetical protein